MTGAYVNPDGREYLLSDGTVARLYGGLGYRYWLGEPGHSEVVAGRAYFWQPVLKADVAEFEADLKEQVRVRVGRTVGVQTGLLPSPGDLERIEWLAIWHPEPDLLDRLAAFEAGWSAMVPPGTRARDLRAEDVSRIGRILAKKAPKHRPRPRVTATTDAPEAPE